MPPPPPPPLGAILRSKLDDLGLRLLLLLRVAAHLSSGSFSFFDLTALLAAGGALDFDLEGTLDRPEGDFSCFLPRCIGLII